MFFGEKHLRFSSKKRCISTGFCDVEKKHSCRIFVFFSSPALPLRCVPGKGAQKGPAISMKSLVNHIAQHKYLRTLSTYGRERFHRLCLGSLPCPRRSWKMVTWKEYPERWARPRSQAKVGESWMFFFWGVRVENHSEYLSIQPIIQKTCIYIMIKNFGES